MFAFEVYDKPLYLCGLYNGAETGSNGWGYMLLTCISNGLSYKEVVDNYFKNLNQIYGFSDFEENDFKIKYYSGRATIYGRTIEIYKIHTSFFDAGHTDEYKLERIKNPLNYNWKGDEI